MDETTSIIEETFQRLKARPNVAAVLLLNQHGQQIKSSLGAGPVADQYATTIASLVQSVKTILKQLDSSTSDTLNFMQLRTSTKEFLIAPNGKFIFAVVETPLGGDNIDATATLSSPTLAPAPTENKDFIVGPPLPTIED